LPDDVLTGARLLPGADVAAAAGREKLLLPPPTLELDSQPVMLLPATNSGPPVTLIDRLTGKSSPLLGERFIAAAAVAAPIPPALAVTGVYAPGLDGVYSYVDFGRSLPAVDPFVSGAYS
jgi:hypothetical protein